MTQQVHASTRLYTPQPSELSCYLGTGGRHLSPAPIAAEDLEGVRSLRLLLVSLQPPGNSFPRHVQGHAHGLHPRHQPHSIF
eukprot:27152-Hanusia_phi.AAC.2